MMAFEVLKTTLNIFVMGIGLVVSQLLVKDMVKDYRSSRLNKQEIIAYIVALSACFILFLSSILNL